MEGKMLFERTKRGRNKYKPSVHNDNSEMRYYREALPNIYREFTRDCLKCGQTFTIGHRYVRTCEACKIANVNGKFEYAF